MRKYDSNKDYYQVLGVGKNSSKEEIDRAYRSEARKRHPDGGGSEEDMKALNEAHEILSDPETRNAYDAAQPRDPIAYGSSAAFDPQAASRAGALKIPVSDEDFVGLCMGAATCFGLGFPLLILVEMQWVFFLWPLRVMSLGALGLGVLLAHSALASKQRQWKKKNPRFSRSRFLLTELLFWAVTVGASAVLLTALYMA